MPVPVMTNTLLPSVTGDGDDIFCLRIFTLPLPQLFLPQHVAFGFVHAPEIKIVALGDVQKTRRAR